jgi:hypothetical protein
MSPGKLGCRRVPVHSFSWEGFGHLKYPEFALFPGYVAEVQTGKHMGLFMYASRHDLKARIDYHLYTFGSFNRA